MRQMIVVTNGMENPQTHQNLNSHVLKKTLLAVLPNLMSSTRVTHTDSVRITHTATTARNAPSFKRPWGCCLSLHY